MSEQVGKIARSDAALTALTRRGFFRAGGALVVGFNMSTHVFGQDDRPRAIRPWQRVLQAGPPDPEQIDTWLAIHADNTATVYIGFVELGQGCSTSLLQVAAEELDLGLEQVDTVGIDTHVTPNQGGTYSSAAIARGGPQVRRAAAEARAALLRMAAERFGVDLGSLTVTRGVVSIVGDRNRTVTYGELIGDRLFDLPFTGAAPVKPPSAYRLVAKPVARRDIPLKASGEYTYIQHQRMPGMLHGRIVRPRGQGAYRDGAALVSIDEGSIADIVGARVVRRGNFVAVVAEDEWAAVKAAQQLKIEWARPDALPGSDRLFEQMRAATTNDRVAVDDGDVDAAFVSAAHVVAFDADCPYQAHVPFGPNCALADVGSDSALVMCSTQDAYNVRMSLANLLGLPVEQVRVQYHEGSGTYGHSCYDDAAQAAALLSQAVGRPVRVQFMRWDEHGWDTYGPAHVGECRVAADSAGNMTAYQYHGWQHHWSLVETSEQLAAGTPASEWPPFPAQQINPRTLGGMYQVPNMLLVNHHVDGLDYLKGAWLRSPLDLSFAFVSEQAVDQLAYEVGMDPVEFRRRNIRDDRWLGVLEAAARAASWSPRRAAANPTDDTVVTGRGIGLGTHLASWGGAVAEIEVNRSTGKVTIKHLYGALDAGLVVNPGIVESQIVGQLVQTASRMLLEEVTFDTNNVTSLDWASYPILRFDDCPDITPVVVQRLNEPYSGAGEEVMAAAASAIANAFFDATGLRMKTYPLTPERVLARLRTA
jgi:CO/xanthine dehydrogenase Mo-binding subunit